MHLPIDPVKRWSWPEAVHLLVKTISTRLSPASDPSASDLSRCTTAEQDEAWEREIHMAMTERRLLAYHATRLLPEEADWISNEGILPLTKDLIDRKILGAKNIHPELIDDKLSQRLREGGPLNWQGTADVRLGFAWTFAPLS